MGSLIDAKVAAVYCDSTATDPAQFCPGGEQCDNATMECESPEACKCPTAKEAKSLIDAKVGAVYCDSTAEDPVQFCPGGEQCDNATMECESPEAASALRLRRPSP